MDGSASNVPDRTGRSFPSPYSVQSGADSLGFHHTGTPQGLHNMQGSYNVPNMSGTHLPRNSTINVVPSGSMQQSTGNFLTGRVGSNNIPSVFSQISHGSSHGHSGVTNREGINHIRSPAYNSSTIAAGASIPVVLPTYGSIGNRGAVSGIGVSPLLGNAGSQITTSMGNAGSQITTSMGNVAGSGSGYIGRSSGGTLSMHGLASLVNVSSNSGYGSLGLQGSNRVMSSGLQQQASPHVISMRGNSYASGGGPLSQGHVQAVNNLSSMATLDDVNSNNNSPSDVDNSSVGARGQIGSMGKQAIGVPTSQQNNEFKIQDEDFPALPGHKGGGAYASPRPHQQQQQQQQQQPQHMPSVSGSNDPYSLSALFKRAKSKDPDVLATGIDLTSLGLNVNSSEPLHKTFGSPFSDKPVEPDPEFVTPESYCLESTLSVNHKNVTKFRKEVLFYIFYSMPKDEAQLYAANELCRRGWHYHKDLKLWILRFPTMEPLVKNQVYEIGCYLLFDPIEWETRTEDKFVLKYDLIEKRPTLPQH
ncbi:hypothetical protein SOVF_105230 [Spinacia oleracea]|nr:probable NOT transcription complex subunit VIP2 isoform X2 [Spinacia oleracea]XP_021843563.1 probable NOT transcription complex subunit VIP2 isoform X2 [Spinacia oleracea]XP_021843564.1 probable NOT transcription complex subunit VIP2 isoform X2 [Spinacia oleracea]XP_056696382.1 probable NOT transcription complex subunit VIP2 isoform X2 [Spinacia oleracea]XP_056696383.1 probable NOT transcription complex subunit VIP2 isoform X2 [Spinacia oleracea]XP_056696384.1 probable NOT transcription com